MASKRSPSTASQKAATCAFTLFKLGAIACALLLLICGTSILRGSHGGRDDLLGKSFSMVSFNGIAAKDAGTTLPYLTRMRWFLNSFAWEWLETSTEINAAGYVFVQPLHPLQMPAALRDVTSSLYVAGHMMNTCTLAKDTCVRASKAFFAAFDSVPRLTLNNGPAFVIYIAAVVLDFVTPAVFSCLAFFSDNGVEKRHPWLRTGASSLPAACHIASASLLTYNASSLVRYLNQFPEIPAGASIGLRFLIVAWCGVLAELLAVAVNVVRVFLARSRSNRRSTASNRSIPSGSRLKTEYA
ncbi:uncharacterized protein CTRU02_204923 [Colletotrichum truncatum]|uniref:Uncharacterized protein n=1 Tax=Colletotrichum truncatum TaxID=5467 RepID=A0ACC3Z2J6_COLTU|nr:uncharacterized protein CTRU02_14017 [Colletotrichum truncatum]KAF6782698.1 hypothetical protein CTRU02_14017 [Colletotrichum truncatum]